MTGFFSVCLEIGFLFKGRASPIVKDQKDCLVKLLLLVQYVFSI